MTSFREDSWRLLTERENAAWEEEERKKNKRKAVIRGILIILGSVVGVCLFYVVVRYIAYIAALLIVLGVLGFYSGPESDRDGFADGFITGYYFGSGE